MRILVAALLVVVVLAGCAPVAESAPTAAPSVEPTSSEPVSTAEPAVERPEQVFGGSCDAVATSEELSAMYGAELKPATIFSPLTSTYIVDNAGGLRCGWALSSDENSWSVVFAVVVPVGAVKAADSLACSSDSGCYVDVTAGGMRLSFVSSGSTSDTDFATGFAALFRTRAILPAPVAAPPSSGTWRAVTDCAQLSDAIDVGEYFGEPGEWAQWGQGRGFEGTPTAMFEMWNTPANTCDWSRGGDGALYGFRIDTLGGGAWVYRELVGAPHMTEVSVAGFEHTIVEETEWGWPVIHFFDDTNWMRTEMLVGGDWALDAKLIGEIARDAADVLDRTAAP